MYLVVVNNHAGLRYGQYAHIHLLKPEPTSHSIKRLTSNGTIDQKFMVMGIPIIIQKRASQSGLMWG